MLRSLETSFLAVLCVSIPVSAQAQDKADGQAPVEADTTEADSSAGGVFYEIAPTLVIISEPDQSEGFGLGIGVGYASPRVTVGFQPAVSYDVVPNLDILAIESSADADTAWKAATQISSSFGALWVAVPFSIFSPPVLPHVGFPRRYPPLPGTPYCNVRCTRAEGFYLAGQIARINVRNDEESGVEGFGAWELWADVGVNMKPSGKTNLALQFGLGINERLDHYFESNPFRGRLQVQFAVSITRPLGLFFIGSGNWPWNSNERKVKGNDEALLAPTEEQYTQFGLALDPAEFVRLIGKL